MSPSCWQTRRCRALSLHKRRAQPSASESLASGHVKAIVNLNRLGCLPTPSEALERRGFANCVVRHGITKPTAILVDSIRG